MPSWNISINGYDSNGNIYLSSIGLPGQMTTSSDSYNSGTNQLQEIGASPYFYTPADRVLQINTSPTMSATSVQNISFTYDILLNRPINIDIESSITTIIIYDATGERIFKSINNMTIQYYHHSPQILYE